MPIIDGKAIAADIEKQITQRVEKLKKKGITPRLAVVVVGSHTPSRTYIRKKQDAAARVGVECTVHAFPASIPKTELIKRLHAIQNNTKLTGLIIQLPLPERLYVPEVLNSINPAIDVDCLTDANIGKLVMKSNFIEPPTPWSVIHILKELHIDLRGKNITLVGAGALVGKPLAIMLVNELATVTVCNEYTKDLKERCLAADIIVSGVGKQNVIRGDMVRTGTIVIDTGIVYEGGKMHGDTDFEAIVKKAAYITPTPGGVGPITVAKLLLNTVIGAEKSSKNKTI